MIRTFVWLLVVCLFTSVSCLAADASAALFKSKCAICHGATGTADTPMAKSLGIKSYKSPDVQRESDADLKATITDGKGKMPSYKTLTPEQTDGLVNYIRTLGK